MGSGATVSFDEGRGPDGGGCPEADLDGPLDPDLPLRLLLVMALYQEAERLVPGEAAPRGPDGAPPPHGGEAPPSRPATRTTGHAVPRPGPAAGPG